MRKNTIDDSTGQPGSGTEPAQRIPKATRVGSVKRTPTTTGAEPMTRVTSDGGRGPRTTVRKG